ncbi:MAG: ATP-dependent Clp protease ATP-binding subunit, partial [Verrucomicrobia bacterium]
NVKAGDRVEVTAADGKLTFHVAEPTPSEAAPAS